MRLNQYLARAGITSRRKAEELILGGQVRLNGTVVTELATNVNPSVDTILYRDQEIRLPEYKYYALNKPAGYTCTREDRHAVHTIYELLPKDSSLISVGRLDQNTTGLLIITNNGHFAQNIIHPKNKIPKTYQVITKAKILNEKELLSGILLDDGPAKATSVKKISDTKVILTIEEGRKRIVRRMMKAIGHSEITLTRVSVGDIKLDIQPSEYRELTKKEIAPYV